MGTKKHSLVDSFVFQKAKESTDQVTKPTSLPSTYPTTWPTYQSPDPLANRQPDQPVIQPITAAYKDVVWSITEKQAKVLAYLIQNKSGVTQKKEICKLTGIAEGTIKDSIRILHKYKFISKPRQFRQGRFQGFSYTINEELCKRFIGERWKQLSDCPPVHPPVHPSSCPSSSISSSSSSTKTTTTLCIDEIVNNHPEFGYWRQKGLTVKQVEFWIKTADCSPESMIKSLCHCRYEMVDMGLEESKPIKNVFNWFYRIVEKTGYYPAPKGYKSFEQKQIERERQFIEEREKRIQELKEIHQKKWEQKRELEFWKMMNESAGELYKQCYEQLSSFEKDLKTSKVFETVMRNAFDKVMLERDQSKLSEDEKELKHE